MAIPKTITDFLAQNKIGYEILRHPEAFTAQTIAQAEHVKGRHHAKVVMVRSGGNQLMIVLPADHRLDLEKLENITGQSAVLQSEDEFKSLFPDCAVGTMPPFGNLYGLTTYVDKSLTKEDYIVFEAGTHTEAIKLNYQDYERLAKPRIEDLAIKLHPIKRA
jgi:Ala-tRNA(Pro) deacylase